MSHVFNLHDSSLGRHVNAASRKSLENQAYSITKPITLLKRKFVWKLVFSCSNGSCKQNLGKIDSFLVWFLVTSCEKPTIRCQSVAQQSVNTILFLITQAEQRKYKIPMSNKQSRTWSSFSFSYVRKITFFVGSVICISAIAFTFALWKSRPPIIDNKSQSSYELLSCTSARSQKHHCTGHINSKKPTPQE